MADKKDKKKLEKEQLQIKKDRKVRMEKLRKEKKLMVKFQNIETPGAGISFNFQSLQTYILEDGRAYELPISVINHLNGLAVPTYKMYNSDEEKSSFRPEPADPSERISGTKNRFALLPIDALDIIEEGNGEKTDG